MKQTTQFLTCAFKLHNPSGWRRAVLDHLFNEYTLAMRDLLAWCLESREVIRGAGKHPQKDKWTADTLARALPSSGDLQVDISSALKEALLGNVASMLASHYSLDAMENVSETGFPSSRDPSPEGLMWAEYELSLVGAGLEDYEQARNNVTRRARGSVMPVHIARSRDIRILADAKQERYFAWIKALPGGHVLGRKTLIQDDNLIDINTGEVFAYRGDSAILVPLEIGRRNGEWHWQYKNFILPVLCGEATVKAAKLIRKDSLDGKHEYFLSVSFEFACPEPYEVQNYLGIDRGILYTMAHAVVDKTGAVILKDHQEDGIRSLQLIAGKRIQDKQKKGRAVNALDYRRKQQEEMMHKLVNRVIEIAIEHQAGIIIEDLSIMVRGKFVRSAWNKLEFILAYKCRLAGVPFLGGVFAAKTSQICIHCGEIVERDNRVLTCHFCGAVEHSDDAAAVNIARRAMYRKKDWEKRGGYREFHRSFSRGR